MWNIETNKEVSSRVLVYNSTSTTEILFKEPLSLFLSKECFHHSHNSPVQLELGRQASTEYRVPERVLRYIIN